MGAASKAGTPETSHCAGICRSREKNSRPGPADSVFFQGHGIGPQLDGGLLLARYCVRSQEGRQQSPGRLQPGPSLNPKRAANYVWRAIVDADQKAYVQAIADLNQALTLEPRYDWAYYHRGRVKALQGNLEQALDDLDWAVTINLFNSQAFWERGKIHLQNKNYDIAIADFSKVIGSESKNYQAYYFRAQAYQALGEAAKAQEDLRKFNELKAQVKGN